MAECGWEVRIVVVDDVQVAVVFDDGAVVVAALSSLVPALGEVEGLVDALCDLEFSLRGEGVHCQSSSGNMMVMTGSPASPEPIATMA